MAPPVNHQQVPADSARGVVGLLTWVYFKSNSKLVVSYAWDLNLFSLLLCVGINIYNNLFFLQLCIYINN